MLKNSQEGIDVIRKILMYTNVCVCVYDFIPMGQKFVYVWSSQ